LKMAVLQLRQRGRVLRILYYNLTALNLHTTLTTTALCDSYFNYVDGLRSSLPHDVESVGIQLLNINDSFPGFDVNPSTGELGVSALRTSSNFMTGFANTEYRLHTDTSATGVRIACYDSKFVFLSTATQASSIWTTAENTSYIRVVWTSAENDVMLNKGSSIIPYQAFKSNYAHVPVTLNQVPTAQDTFDIKTGVLGVNTKEHFVTEANVIQLTSNDQGLDLVLINTPTGRITPTTNTIDGTVRIEGLAEVARSYGQTVPNTFSTADNFYSTSSLNIVLPAGTYAIDTPTIGLTALENAKAGLAGTKIIYELADASKYTIIVTHHRI
jgi:hypothetical protein